MLNAIVRDLDTMDAISDAHADRKPEIVVANVLDAVSFEWSAIIHIWIYRDDDGGLYDLSYLQYQARSRALGTFIELSYGY